MGASRRVNPSFTGEAKLTLAGWDQEFVSLEEGGLLDFDLMGSGVKSQRSNNGTAVLLARMLLIDSI